MVVCGLKKIKLWFFETTNNQQPLAGIIKKKENTQILQKLRV